MQNLHDIPASSPAASFDELVSPALWHHYLNTYQQDIRVPRLMDYRPTNAYTGMQFDYDTVDTQAVIRRLDALIARIRVHAIDSAEVSLRVSRAELRALLFIGYLHDSREPRYRGVRLFVDG